MGKTLIQYRRRSAADPWLGSLHLSVRKTHPCQQYRKTIDGSHGQLPIQSHGIAPQHGVWCRVHAGALRLWRARSDAFPRTGGALEASGVAQRHLASCPDRRLCALFFSAPTSFLVAAFPIFVLAWLKL